MKPIFPPSTPAECRADLPALFPRLRAGLPPSAQTRLFHPRNGNGRPSVGWSRSAPAAIDERISARAPWLHELFRLRAVFFCLPLLLVACRDSKVSSYRIPKEKEPAMIPESSAPMPASSNMAGAPVMNATGADLLWTAPPQWKAKAASSMRKGSYVVGEGSEGSGDLAITAFPGEVGGELANINRWRGQLKLPPITAAELPGLITRVEHNGLKFAVVELVGESGTPVQRMLGASVAFNGSTWFVKLTGPDALVAQAKPDFLAFLQTVKMPSPSIEPSVAPAPTMSVNAAPAPATTPGMAGASVPTASGPGLAWTAPQQWENKPGSAMRRGSFAVVGEKGETADLSITAFPGAVGGELANINRWRGQLALAPLNETEFAATVTRLSAGDWVFTVVDYASTGAPAQRILGAMVPYQDAMWFFKMTGPDALVVREKPAFLEFLRTVRANAVSSP